MRQPWAQPAAARNDLLRLRLLVLLALAITVTAIAGCSRGRAEESPARIAQTVTSADTMYADTVPAPAASVGDTAAPWRFPRDPGDRCRRADGSDERPHRPWREGGATEYEDLSRGLAFLCTLRDGRHPARLVLQAYDDGHPERVLVYDPPADTATADTLFIEEAERPYAGTRIVEGEDLDGDGWTDVRVRTFAGVGGLLTDVFRYDPARRRFERDSVLSRESYVRRVGARCLQTSWKRSIRYGWLKTRCWRNGGWVVVRFEERTYDESLSTRDSVVYVTETRELRGGRMRLVRADTTLEPNE